MPHQVVKCSVRGSVGDLAKITAALEREGYNILATGGGEVNHLGIIALLFDPDTTQIPGIIQTIQGVELGPGRRPEDVEAFPDVHILLNDAPGQLRRAVEALGDINIETIVTIDKQPGNRTRVSLGFQPGDFDEAVRRLRAAHIPIHDHKH